MCVSLRLDSFGQEMMKLQISEKGVCFGVTEVQVSAGALGKAGLEVGVGIKRRKWAGPAVFATTALPLRSKPVHEQIHLTDLETSTLGSLHCPGSLAMEFTF